MAANDRSKDSAKAAGPIRFLREVKQEAKKITWPSKEETKKSIAAVIAIAIAVSVLVGVVDFVFRNLFEFIFKL